MSFDMNYKAFVEITDALAKSCATADGSLKNMAKAMQMFNDLTVTGTHTHGFTMSGEYEVQRSVESRRTQYKGSKQKPKPEPEKPETFGMWS